MNSAVHSILPMGRVIINSGDIRPISHSIRRHTRRLTVNNTQPIYMYTFRLAFAMAFLAVCGVFFAYPAQSVTATTQPVTQLALEGCNLQLNTTIPAAPLDGEFTYNVAVKPARSTNSLVLRFDVRRENGSLIYRRTRYISGTQLRPDGATQKPLNFTEQFSRELAGLGMDAGLYRITVEATVATDQARTTAQLSDTFVVYDPENDAIKLVPIVRISASPMRTPEGVFLRDPKNGIAYAQSSALSELCGWVIANNNARFTLALSPLVLEEWVDISDGYVLASTNATTPVVDTRATGETARHYAGTIASLKQALATGRITLAQTGYASPRFRSIEMGGANSSLGLMLSSGSATLTRILGVTPSPVAAPIDGYVSNKQLEALSGAGIQRIVVARLLLGGSTRTSLRLPNGMTALGYASTETTAANGVSSNICDLYQQHAKGSTLAVQELVLESSVRTIAAKVAGFKILANQPWVTMSDPVTVEGHNKKALPLYRPKQSDKIPASFHGVVNTASIEALYASVGLGSALIESTQDEQAQTYAMVGLFGQRAIDSADDVALINQYSGAAQRLCDAVFSKISLTVAPITLASSEGILPITVTNNSGQMLNTTLVLNASEDVQFSTPTHQNVELPQKESFFEPKILLRNVSSEKVMVSLMAGNYVISTKTVRVNASYMDRIAIVIGIALVGILFGFFIWRRSVATSQSTDDRDGSRDCSENTNG